jgi:RHS repeat-associated protein
LTQAVVNGTGAESYSYDAVGNRLTSAGPTSYTYNSSNELTSSSAATYTYDNNGNTISKTTTAGTTSYTWDFENRLASVTLPGTGGTVNFKYDPIGRRIEKVAPTSGTTIYAYDGDSVTEELGAGGNLLAYYTQGAGIDEPLGIAESGGTYYYHADGLGSITSLTSGAGQLANSYVYDSFGNLTASTGTITNPFQYTGRELDSETGLYYYRARYYDPPGGRFISEDPSRFLTGINFYEYVRNSPATLADPSGERIAVTGSASAWQEVTLYLGMSPFAEEILAWLQDSSTTFVVNISDTYTGENSGRTYGRYKVYWNPDEAECVKNGIQSPAIQLLHELIHLVQLNTGVTGDLEEEATQLSNIAAAELGEPIRTTYGDAIGTQTWASPIAGSGPDSCKCNRIK